MQKMLYVKTAFIYACIDAISLVCVCMLEGKFVCACIMFVYACMLMYLHVYCLYKWRCLYLQPHQAPIHMCMYVYVFACIIYIGIYMHICLYICIYVYICVCISFVCYNNTIFHHICTKPRWLSGRYGLI